MTLLIATTNQSKLREICAVLADLRVRPTTLAWELVTLADVPPIPEPSENGATFWENAREKAIAYARASGIAAVAEDSGLEILALDNEPGVQSARFLGHNVSYEVRFEEIYRRLRTRGAVPSDARFVTALAVAEPNGTVLFETETAIEGTIANRPTGTNGFGYDPIFYYPPFGKTTGELTIGEKCAVSHRARAFRNLRRWLKET